MNLLSELVAALRFWTRRPVVAIASILSLAVGLAVASSVFAVADATLWQPLPIRGADRVVWINSVDRGVADATSPGVFSAWASGAGSLEAIGALRPAQSVFRDDQPGQRVAGVYASAGVMKVLAVQPVLGRAIGEQDDRPGAPLVLVLSERFWRSQYAASPSVVGRAVTLDGKVHTIVGVMAASIDRVPFGYDWWAPLALSAKQAANIGPRYLSVIGRLRSADRAPRRPNCRPCRAMPAPSATPGPRSVSGSNRSRLTSQRVRGRFCCRCWAPCWRWCYSDRSMPRACCWRRDSHAAPKSRCAPPSAPAVRDWFANCYSNPPG